MLIAITACSGPVEGQAGPATEAGNSTPTRNTAPATTSTSGNSLDETDPCKLLTKGEAEQVTGPQRKEPALEKLGSARTCQFTPQLMSFGIGIRTNVGLTGVQSPGEVLDLTVGSHQAKRFIASGGSCIIAIGVTPSSRVDVVFNAPSDKDPCQFAKKIADLVEPRLP